MTPSFRSLAALRRTLRPRAALAAVALLLAPGAVARAVTVSPSALYIDQRTRSGVLTLANTGTLPEEIDIGFAFGYPKADSLGNVSVPLFEVAPEGEPSLLPYVRAFPRRLRLEPGQKQVVRIFVQAPGNLPAGEYWARVIVRSRGGQPPIEQQQGDIKIQVNLETVVVAAASYRNGAVATGIEVDAPTAEAAGDSAVKVAFPLRRGGNAAYLGRVKLTVHDASGAQVAEYREDVAVYREMRRVFQVMLPSRRPLAGYTVKWSVDGERTDLPDGGALPSTPRSGSIPVR